MTTNIIAEFACSRYTDADFGRIPTGKSVGDFKEYPVIVGSNFSDEYNETLNSGTIVLSQVVAKDRLSYIKSYQYVRVYDKTSYNSTTGKYDFDMLFLVDNFQEKENNITEHIFQYTIRLMSETKWLEKFQCPNLTQTHKIFSNGSTSKKTIYQYICRYMDLYVPKIKYSSNGTNWSYKLLITVPGHNQEEDVSVSWVNADFEQQGSDYILTAHSSTVVSEADLDSVKSTSIVIGNTYRNVLSECTATFDKLNRYFVLHAVAKSPSVWPLGQGIATINYVYDDTTNDFYKHFNVSSFDSGSSAYTLRQLLTLLMNQIGCIPTVSHRVLGYLDYQKDAVSFADNGDYTLGNTVNFINRSLSSDSFVNTLVNMSEGVLDSENQVISETLGFRDKSSILLKQTQNLYLETRFPIYKVEKFTINFSGNGQLNYPKLHTSVDPTTYRNDVNTTVSCIFGFKTATDIPNGFTITTRPGTNIPRISFCVDAQQSPNLTLRGPSIYPLKATSDGGYDYFYNGDIIADYPGDLTTTTGSIIYHADFPELEGETVDAAYIDFMCDLTYYKDPTGTNVLSFRVINSTFELTDGFVTTFKQDITPLLKENSVRQYLKTDFTEMENDDIETLEDLAKYVYGTIGYSIGSKTISGFSQVYNVGSTSPLGWLQRNYTYIENILNFIKKNIIPDEEFIKSITDKFKIPFVVSDIVKNSGERENNLMLNNVGIIFPDISNIAFFGLGEFNFVELFFDIVYQPLNSFNLNFVKQDEDIDIPISQYDGNASGLTDFDRLSIHEQEQVDRIGNETLFISQRVPRGEYSEKVRDFSEGPLVFKDDTNRDGDIDDDDKGVDYIIFKRSYQINNNCYNVSYTGSKDAVLKNYFTSIRTKYRAYQYVDYNSSVLRKEKDVVFVRLGEDYYDGDDRIWLGSLETENHNYYDNLSNFLCYIAGEDYDENDKKLKYVVSHGRNDQAQEQYVKNDISLITNRTSFSIIYEDCDNVGNGTYISNENFERSWDLNEYQDDDGERKPVKIGGVPQSWQIWDEETYNEKHMVSYLHDIDFYDKEYYNNYENAIIPPNPISTPDLVAIIARLYGINQQAALSPIVKDDLIDTQDPAQFAITVVDKNDGTNFERTFYKDYAERINHTVQFIYYSSSKNILFTGNLIDGNKFCGKTGAGHIINAVTTSEDFSVSEEDYALAAADVIASGSSVGNYISVDEGGNSITVTWNDQTILKFGYYSGGLFRDFIAFRKPKNAGSTTTFYLSLNDTKSDYVMSEKNGILHRKYKVDSTLTGRRVKNNNSNR